MNCIYYDDFSTNKCSEPAADWVPDKEKANFCEFFEFRVISTLSSPGLGGAQSDHDRARAAFDGLFGRKRR